MFRAIKALKGDQRGVTMVEYAFIAVLVSIAAVTLLIALGANVSGMFTSANGAFPP